MDQDQGLIQGSWSGQEQAAGSAPTVEQPLAQSPPNIKTLS